MPGKTLDTSMFADILNSDEEVNLPPDAKRRSEELEAKNKAKSVTIESSVEDISDEDFINVDSHDLFKKEAIETIPKAKAAKTRPEPNKRSRYSKKEILSISDLKGNEEEVTRYLVKKLRDSGSIGSRLFVELPCGLIDKELNIERNLLKNVLWRLKKKGVITKTELKGNPRHGTVSYHLKHSIFGSICY